jgi:hypothetical protein
VQGVDAVDGERGSVVDEVSEHVEVEVREVAGVVDGAEGEGNTQQPCIPLYINQLDIVNDN